jgi:hypothetical protein
MRVLTYKVKGQRLTTTGDHSGLIAGTKGYLKAQFEFDDDWKDCIKVASFIGNGEHAVKLDNNSCIIPNEALTSSTFKVKVEGRRSDGYRIITGSITERQKGGNS